MRTTFLLLALLLGCTDATAPVSPTSCESPAFQCKGYWCRVPSGATKRVDCRQTFRCEVKVCVENTFCDKRTHLE